MSYLPNVYPSLTRSLSLIMTLEMEAPTIQIEDIKPGMLAEKPVDSIDPASPTEESMYPDRAILTST